jgi:MFS superfamily sulfate permease-like transporter
LLPDYATDTEAAMDTAAQAALCCGIILAIMSILNLGHLINFISLPVMSGFTTAAAALIGLSQIKSAFGFTQKIPATPQQGQPGYEFNYQVMKWYISDFYGRYTTYSSDSNFLTKGEQYGHLWINPYSVKICFGLYIPLMLIQILKNNIPATPERKKQLWYRIFLNVNSLLPFIAIIIGAHIAWRIHSDDGYNAKLIDHDYYKSGLKVIGKLTPGLKFARIPNIRWPMGKFLADCVPLTMIAYMESYSVARRIAANRNELHILSASQEMWGNGVANLIASVCSGYPVSGSFSRSSLNYASGARTPLSKIVTVCIVLLALGAMTKTMYYIPNAALAAVIFLAISNLINLSDYWEAWKHSKKDFFVIILTTTIVFVFDSSVGLAAGLGASVIVVLADIVLGRRNAPWVSKGRKGNNGIDVVKLESDVSFLNSYRIKDFVSNLYIQPPALPEADSSFNQKAFHSITTTLDYYLRPDVLNGVEDVPAAVALDFSICRLIDLTGLKVISEVLHEGRGKNVKFVLFNVHPELVPQFTKFGIVNDSSTKQINLDIYLAMSDLKVKKTAEDSVSDSDEVDVEAAIIDGGDLKGVELVSYDRVAADDHQCLAASISWLY